MAVGRAPPITKAEARSLPTEDVKSRVLEQLSEILTEERPHDGGPPPTRPLRDMSFITSPKATGIPGLCQLDRLYVTFRWPKGGRRNADTPTWADSFSSTRYFHFLRPPEGEDEDMVDYDPAPDDALCRSTKPWEGEFFTAPDDRDAKEGYMLAHRVMNEIVEGAPQFPLECDKYPTEQERECSDILREVSASQIMDIERCEVVGGPEFSRASCYLIYIGDLRLRIIASPSYVTATSVRSSTILSVRLDQMIVMSHTRID